MTITALIIDDEELARALIKSYLKSHVNVEVVGECANGFEGIKAIQDLRPDLVFLDVQMPKLTGFEMLELLDCLSHFRRKGSTTHLKKQQKELKQMKRMKKQQISLYLKRLNPPKRSRELW